MAVVTSLGGFFVTYGQMQTRLDYIEERREASASLMLGLEGRIRALEASGARQDERLAGIYNLLNRIDTRLERIERAD
ncbi:hypothetical protein [Pelagibaca abyssi]|uniref:Uncharacterized protein n=1 Tax=Salipiger abyssi TaxID=1250539 RepID=A0A1P8UWJ4_9RHOB|nr:hypothetical protein Ga0080574_TMP878 [Salipiger abyssi]APZ53758.1 hypothetical protein Ga0080574_TMP3424 [Salipiger abyssi]